MNSTPYKLAALAVVAVNGLEAVGVREPFTRTADFQYGGVLDARGRRWIVKYPLHAVAATMIEAEAALAPELLTALRQGLLPCDVIRPAGFAQVKHGRAVVYQAPLGRTIPFDALDMNKARALGGVLAAIHSLPTDVIKNAGLPLYNAQTTRDRLRVELHDIDTASPLPPAVRRRWEEALDDDSLWGFTPRVVHGDVAAEQFLWAEEAITCTTGFGAAHVGDPATDFAALMSAVPEPIFDAIADSYDNAIGAQSPVVDDAFLARAMLLSEFALARWLMFGVHNSDNAIIDDAQSMLDDLAQEIIANPDIATGPSWDVAPVETSEQ